VSAAPAVIRRGISDQRFAVVTWGSALGLMGAFIAAIYPSVKDSLAKVVQSYPSGLKEAFGVTGFDTVESYVHAEMFSLIVPLAIGFFAIRSATRETVTAEENGYLETLLSLPLQRRILVGGSALATMVICAGILAVTGLLIFVAGRIAGTGISLGLTFAGAFGLWPLAVFFAGVASVVGGLVGRSAEVTGIATGILVGMYVLDLAGRLADGLEPVRWFSAFRYYGAPLRDGIDISHFVALSAAGIVLIGVGAVLFDRRDLRH
jgi:beta-exotoxin I transport system permease protein